LKNNSILLNEVRTNNLKGFSVEFPLYKLSVVTGVSGSGKSSLVFDTLYGEAYRRYVDSLSSFARQYLKVLDRPNIASIKNLPPAIAVGQSKSGASNRSTVGSLTEIYDVLRLIFSHLAVPNCPNGHGPVLKAHPKLIWTELLDLFPGDAITIGAALNKWKAMKGADLKKSLEEQGFTRILVEGEVLKLNEVKTINVQQTEVLIDRLSLVDELKSRFYDGVLTGFKAGRGFVNIHVQGKSFRYGQILECKVCEVPVSLPNSSLLNCNHPLGACEKCQGYGMEPVVDWDKVFVDKTSSIFEEGIVPLNFGSHTSYYKDIKKSADTLDFNIKKPFSSFTSEEWQWIKFGVPSKTKKKSNFGGIQDYFDWLDSKKYKAHYRMHAARFRKYVKCTVCHGERLGVPGRFSLIDGESIGQVQTKSISELSDWLDKTKDAYHGSHEEIDESGIGLNDAFMDLEARLGYLKKIGLSYLSPSRSSKSLSGGELQRINMARCLGSALTDTLFCLDEPTAGLHAKDSKRLLSVLEEIRDMGNTVVVVEHEPLIFEGSDHLIEIGPGAGYLGGDLTFSGSPNHLKVEPVQFSFAKRQKWQQFIELKGVCTHNLKNIDVKFPVGALVGVAGVSGSGKTSLIQHSLYPTVLRALEKEQVFSTSEPIVAGIYPGNLGDIISDIDLVSQGGLGRSSRSTIVTYLGVMDGIRKILAELPESKSRKLMPGAFSFNVPGGRCENCKGLGTVTEDLSFLGEMQVKCPTCEGRRFGEKVLEVHYKGKNLNDILTLTVDEARLFFSETKAITNVLDHIIAMGLGYVSLGQNTSSFSGGEAQRLKLVDLLKDTNSKKLPSLLIFDEPTTGLSERDVPRLIAQLRRLTLAGHTVIVVEHHLGLLRSVDWLLEIGPLAASSGGELVFQGHPEDLQYEMRSETRKYLFKTDG
jgi:excinuclease ABC subunit A